ncbi:hypothetical protein DL546_005398 [Coniochaeta pulveracea]|uniref:Uncharacterized protein n=1 Tax=Coniochaeta pulveracea TaxID=177199 RepID=A0A420YEQ0_9PEZI|nr:hypothetical protein DL546_005398 [Coniochaeta pulveracea]
MRCKPSHQAHLAESNPNGPRGSTGTPSRHRDWHIGPATAIASLRSVTAPLLSIRDELCLYTTRYLTQASYEDTHAPRLPRWWGSLDDRKVVITAGRGGSSVMANYLIVETAPRRNGHAVVTSANMHSSCGTTHRQGPAQYRPD